MAGTKTGAKGRKIGRGKRDNARKGYSERTTAWNKAKRASTRARKLTRRAAVLAERVESGKMKERRQAEITLTKHADKREVRYRRNPETRAAGERQFGEMARPEHKAQRFGTPMPHQSRKPIIRAEIEDMEDALYGLTRR